MIINMIKLLVGSIKCKRTGHELGESVSCPFTGKTYKGCSRCGATLTL